jgi:hypothetical protein
MGSINSRMIFCKCQSDSNNCSNKKTRKKGFALILALSTMSIVLLALVAMTALAKVEIAASNQNLAHLQARQNALLGIMIAIGELQRYAGPDQRVTARAEIFAAALQDDDPRLLWTGVWDSENPTDPPYWLVSRSPVGDFNDTEIFNYIEILPQIHNPLSATTYPAVKVPFIATNNGNVAFWVSDESLKGSLNSRSSLSPQTDKNWLSDFLTECDKHVLNQQLAENPGVLQTLGLDPIPVSERTKLFTLSEIPLAYAMAESEDFTSRYLHHLTDETYGVLANTLPRSNPHSGLKKDLSLKPELHSQALADALDRAVHMEPLLAEADPAQREFAWEGSLRRRHFIRPQATDPATDDPVFSITPILTDFYMLIGLNRASSNDRNRIPEIGALPTTAIVARTQFHFEFWNPYSSALVPEDMIIEITGLPSVLLKTNNPESSHIAIDLQRVFMTEGAETPQTFTIRLPFKDTGFNSTDSRSWLPGRVYSWVGPNNYSAGDKSPDAKFYDRELSTGIWVRPTGQFYPQPFNQNNRFGLSVQNPIQITVHVKTSTGATIALFEAVEFEDFSTPTDAYAQQTTATQFGFRFQLNEPGLMVSDDPYQKGAWLRQYDLREPRQKVQSTAGIITDELYIPPNGLVPTDYTSTSISESQTLFDRTMGATGKNIMEDIPLFEIPRLSPLSVGELQHLRIHARRPQSIGNRWGKTLNSAFDQFFFSGADKELLHGLLPINHTPLPNRRLVPWQRTDTLTAAAIELIADEAATARHFFVSGAFNVNSTSPIAWQSILAAHQIDAWRHVHFEGADAPGVGLHSNNNTGDQDSELPTFEKPLANAFFRFPQTAQETYQIGQKRSQLPGFDPEPPTEFFRQGVVQLADEDIKALSTAIATRVKEALQIRGRPFETLAAFLSETPFDALSEFDDTSGNVLERALADVPSIHRRNVFNPQPGMTELQEIWHHTPNFLSSADIMTNIAPYANVRGDTFKIRAIGSSKNSLNATISSRVTIQATVQRLPVTVWSDPLINNPDPQLFGRQFIITFISELAADEIR